MIPSRGFVEGTVMRCLSTTKWNGFTVREFLLDMPQSHHGQASGVFSYLHKAGAIHCLRERRNGYCVYVLPKYTKGRPTRPHASVSREQRREALLLKADELQISLDDAYTDRYDEMLVRKHAYLLLGEIDKQYR